jgi:hypothetical protein
MPKFAVGDTVEKAASGESRAVVGIFTTDDGEPRYAVESEGALDFVVEAELVSRQTKH